MSNFNKVNDKDTDLINTGHFNHSQPIDCSNLNTYNFDNIIQNNDRDDNNNNKATNIIDALRDKYGSSAAENINNNKNLNNNNNFD